MEEGEIQRIGTTIMKTKRLSLVVTTLTLALAIFVASHASADAPITWSGATAISGTLDVSTTGTSVAAYRFGNQSVTSDTVNGVTFAPFGIPPSSTTFTVDSLTLAASPSTMGGFSLGLSPSAPFSGLDPSYQTLLSTVADTANSSTLTLTMGGLTSGQQYIVQWWNSNSTASQGTTQASDSFSNAVTLDDNTSPTNAAGGIGQYAIGTFTANGTSETLIFSHGPGNTTGLVTFDAIQLRAIPEPSVWALLGASAGMLSLFLRRCKKA